MDLDRSLTGLELLRCNSFLLEFFHFVRGPVVNGLEAVYEYEWFGKDWNGLE